MARKTVAVFVPTASPSGSSLLNLADIPDEIKAEAEEVYAALKANDGRFHVEFDTKAEVNTFARQMDSYCRQRPEELGGPIRFRKSPTRGQADNVIDFRITDVPAKDEAEAATVNADGTPKRKPGRPKKNTTTPA